MNNFGLLVVFQPIFLLCPGSCSKYLQVLTPTSLSTSKASDEDGDFAELYLFKWTTLPHPANNSTHHKLGGGGCRTVHPHCRCVVNSPGFNFLLLWVRVDPFTTRVTGPDVEVCGINC
ncbi:hypothetical protein M0R45_036920 [Rubus argutus]|uniref:Secreted protein n=1 Tax=Rubus argutus TaxID=59490 RepID=A0AAW1VYX7_RUBAR